MRATNVVVAAGEISAPRISESAAAHLHSVLLVTAAAPTRLGNAAMKTSVFAARRLHPGVA